MRKYIQAMGFGLRRRVAAFKARTRPRTPQSPNTSQPVYRDHSHLRQPVPIRVKAPAFHITRFCKNEPKIPLILLGIVKKTNPNVPNFQTFHAQNTIETSNFPCIFAYRTRILLCILRLLLFNRSIPPP
jgi:hypothetical protein